MRRLWLRMAVGDKRTCSRCGRKYIESDFGHECREEHVCDDSCRQVHMSPSTPDKPVDTESVDTSVDTSVDYGDVVAVHTQLVDSARRRYKTEWQRLKRAQSQQYVYPDLPPGYTRVRPPMADGDEYSWGERVQL